jgi:hypothetical protein
MPLPQRITGRAPRTQKDEQMTTLRGLALTLLAAPILGASILATPALAQEATGTTTWEAAAQFDEARPDDARSADARIADADLLEAAVTSHERAADRTRADLAELLSNDEVRDLATARGLSIERLEDAAATLSEQELTQVAPLVSEVTAALQERITVTISAVTIIIILLLLILLT